MSIETLPPGSCKHRPISNGWSGGSWDRVTYSWCGYCRAFIAHDQEWLEKFAKAGRPVDLSTPDPDSIMPNRPESD